MPVAQVIAWVVGAALVGAVAGFVLTPWITALVRARWEPETPAETTAGDGMDFEPRIARWINRRVLTGGAAVSAATAALVTAPPSVRLTMIAAAVIGWLLVCIDAAIHKLPNPLVMAAAVVIGVGLSVQTLAGAADVGAGIAEGTEPLVRAAICAVGGFAAFAVLHALKPSALGRGDIKLAGVCGLALGWFGWNTPLVAVWAAFIGAGIFAVGLIATRRGNRSTMIAFGPWLIFGTAVAIALT